MSLTAMNIRAAAAQTSVAFFSFSLLVRQVALSRMECMLRNGVTPCIPLHSGGTFFAATCTRPWTRCRVTSRPAIDTEPHKLAGTPLCDRKDHQCLTASARAMCDQAHTVSRPRSASWKVVRWPTRRGAQMKAAVCVPQNLCQWHSGFRSNGVHAKYRSRRRYWVRQANFLLAFRSVGPIWRHRGPMEPWGTAQTCADPRSMGCLTHRLRSRQCSGTSCSKRRAGPTLRRRCCRWPSCLGAPLHAWRRPGRWLATPISPSWEPVSRRPWPLRGRRRCRCAKAFVPRRPCESCPACGPRRHCKYFGIAHTSFRISTSWLRAAACLPLKFLKR
mmetsp:Transcript_157901/g.506425  ORF Transcript_157901/g.506425 Transcript_157901/m.506425 type:complete len:331 (-) Transcript_157901:106-1098(-)